MKHCITIIIAASIILLACKTATLPQVENVAQSITIPLSSCSNLATVTNKIFTICYDSLLFDNRCPDLAMCVRRGEVGVKLSFKKNNINIPFRLADFPSILGNFPSDTTINGIHIKLIDVLAHPFSNQNAEKKVILEIN